MTDESTRRTDPECLFCKIVSGAIPAEIVHEDEATIAFRDLQPQAPVHVLVIPRHHVEGVAELARERPDDTVALLRAVEEVATKLRVATTGYRGVFNRGLDAEQSVFHAHIHVLGGRELQWPPG